MIGLEEVCRLHDAAVEIAGQESGGLTPWQAHRLRGALDRAAAWADEGDPIWSIAAVGVLVAVTEAFPHANLRTALAVVATLLERSGLPHTSDWLSVARALAEPIGNPAAATTELARALAPPAPRGGPLPR